ncbi:MAG: hypothetical protein HGA42_12060 [Nostocales cyanobacterium W4_Combined_metabat2_030]|jgi:hypothetical protein|nr:hypothetical protein [Nostocales cyanobacterium W4_Combined_metabat2_030]
MKLLLAATLITLFNLCPAFALPEGGVSQKDGPSKPYPYEQLGKCDFPEEPPSSTEVTATYPKFNIQMKIAENSNSMLLKNGDILIVDRGTYRFLQCLNKYPRAGGKDIFGILISRGSTSYSYQAPIPGKPNMFIVHNTDYLDGTNLSYTIALRIVTSKGLTDVTMSGQLDPLIDKKEIANEVKSLKAIADAITIIR